MFFFNAMSLLHPVFLIRYYVIHFTTLIFILTVLMFLKKIELISWYNRVDLVRVDLERIDLVGVDLARVDLER